MRLLFFILGYVILSQSILQKQGYSYMHAFIYHYCYCHLPATSSTYKIEKY